MEGRLKVGTEATVTSPMAPLTRPPSRRLVVSAVGLIAALSLLTACLRPDQDLARTEMNQDRRANGLRSLSVQADAQRKAQAWAERLARDNTIYHSTLTDGIGVRWCSLGENVGYGPSVPAIEDAYMASPGHRENILASRWNGVGTGVAYNGSRVFTVQVFIQTC